MELYGIAHEVCACSTQWNCIGFNKECKTCFIYVTYETTYEQIANKT